MAKNNIAARWLVGTLGLILIAFGVALSLKSNLGTAPPSCPPAVLNLKWGAISFGTFTWIMHLFFIGAQMAMRRKVLDVHYLLQLAAAFAWICFGSPFGHGEEIVIREGTLILAGLTGLCMKLTDPLVDKVFKPLLHE